MPGPAFLQGYSGQTVEELIGLEKTHRVDSLVLAFEQAIQAKPTNSRNKYENTVLAVEALEREVNNGGYSQFFLNESATCVHQVIEALNAIGCLRTASVTESAFKAMGIRSAMSTEEIQQRASSLSEADDDALNSCDSKYHGTGEAIADALFAWIKANRSRIRVP